MGTLVPSDNVPHNTMAGNDAYMKNQTINFLEYDLGLENFHARHWSNLQYLCKKVITHINEPTASMIQNVTFSAQDVANPAEPNPNSKDELIAYLRRVNMDNNNWDTLSKFCQKAIPVIENLGPNQQLDFDIIKNDVTSPGPSYL